MKTPFNIQHIAKTAGILFAGLLLGWFFFGGTSPDQSGNIEQHVQDNHTDEQGNIVYTCSMHPNVRESEPGNCPICGMELVPLSDANGSEEENPYELTMSPAAMKLAEVQTSRVVHGDATRTLRMPGKIAVDERRISNVTAHFPGRIKELFVDFTGEQVDKGQRLASIYSPQLLTAQRELLETMKHKEQNHALYEATRRKLKLWELPDEEIERIENSGEVITDINIVSPTKGYVLKRNISTQDHVMEGTVMYEIANLSRVWVLFNAYESDLAHLKVGDEISFTVEAYPGETFSASVTYIDPVLDPESRTVSVRAEADNPNRRLKPQMLAEGMVKTSLSGGQNQLMVPKSAVLWTGERSVVYVKKPNTQRPTFEFREVVLGPRVDDYYMVKSGLEHGEEVVTNGNFKIDSAAQLAGKASMMNRNPDGSMPAGHDHGSMEMNTPDRQEIDSNSNSNASPPSDTTGHQHSDHLSSLVENYLAMKGTLESDQLDLTKKHLQFFRNEVKQSREMNNHNEHAQMHGQHHAAMVKAVETAWKADNLEQFRIAFSSISENLVKALENQNYSDQTLYLQYCPMANNSEGAHWLSETEQIKNPYMGEQMSECGDTQQIINTESK